MRSVACLLLCAAVAGCVASDADPAGALPTYVTISDAGAGGIGAGTRYGEASLKAALPGADIRGVEAARENGTGHTLAAFVDGVQVVQVFKAADGSVGEIHGVTHRLAGPNGERIGMSLRQAGLSRESCRIGRNLWRGMAVCPARRSQQVTLVFSIPGYDGPFDELPAAAVIGEAELQRIIWQAP